MPKLQFKLRKGLDIPLSGRPRGEIDLAPPVETVAVLPGDYPGYKPIPLVEEGERVELGQPLTEDRNDSRLRLPSLGSGIVSGILRGPRRALRSIVVTLEGDAQRTFPSADSGELASMDAAIVRERLLESGLWVALRTRPYGHIASPDARPHAIFVTAMDTNPLAADPRIAIAESEQDFRIGLEVLTRLLEGNVYVCCAPGPDLPLPDDERVIAAEFAGPHPAGLPGTHIHFISPVTANRSVWYLGYQGVIGMGHLFRTGRIRTERIISLAGPAVLDPRLLRTRAGASTEDLVRDQIDEDSTCRIISGSVLSGRAAAGWGDYLGRYHNQITVLREGHEREFLGWLMPGMRKYSASRAFLASLLPKRSFPLTTTARGSPRAMVPIGAFERVMPMDLLPTQLLRAIAVSDTDSAQQLGCLELEEEDVALCSFVCASKYDYGPLLRQVLERIEKEG